MCTVDIRIGHQDDMVIAGPLHVEIVPYSGTDSRYQRLDLGVFQDLVLRRLLDVQDLSPQGEDRLELPVPALLCGTACRISFHDVEFALRRVPLLAVGEFSGKAGRLERTLPPCELTCGPGGLPGPGSRHCLIHDHLESSRVLLEVLGERGVDKRVDNAPDVAVPEAHLGLPLELRVRHPGADDAGEPFPDIFTLDLGIVVLEEVVTVRGVVDRTGESAPEALEVGAPFPGIHAVDVGVDRLRVGVIVLQGHLNLDHVLGVALLEVDDIVVEALFSLTDVGDELPDAVLETVGGRIAGALVPEDDRKAAV